MVGVAAVEGPPTTRVVEAVVVDEMRHFWNVAVMVHEMIRTQQRPGCAAVMSLLQRLLLPIHCSSAMPIGDMLVIVAIHFAIAVRSSYQPWHILVIGCVVLARKYFEDFNVRVIDDVHTKLNFSKKCVCEFEAIAFRTLGHHVLSFVATGEQNDDLAQFTLLKSTLCPPVLLAVPTVKQHEKAEATNGVGVGAEVSS